METDKLQNRHRGIATCCNGSANSSVSTRQMCVAESSGQSALTGSSSPSSHNLPTIPDRLVLCDETRHCRLSRADARGWTRNRGTISSTRSTHTGFASRNDCAVLEESEHLERDVKHDGSESALEETNVVEKDPSACARTANSYDSILTFSFHCGKAAPTSRFPSPRRQFRIANVWMEGGA